MALAEVNNEYSLQLKRIFKVTPQQLFEAWTDPNQVTKWLGPDRSFATRVHELELRVGGRYRFEMTESDGSKHIVAGEYVSISPGKQLVFTWGWEHMDDTAESLVTIDIVQSGDNTEMVLTHEKFTDQNIRDLHDEGWIACLAGLDILFS